MPGFDTAFPADSIEFCPHPEASTIFACGTYKLNPANGHQQANSKRQHRVGRCLVFETDPHVASQEPSLRILQQIDLPAIPDMKWCHRSPSTSPILAVADSEGSISLFEWDFTNRHMTPKSNTRCADDHILCLSLDWANRRVSSSAPSNLVVSLSNGHVCLLQPGNGHSMIMSKSWRCHDYECWVAAWDYGDTSVLYSGGDDLTLKAWDIREGFERPLFSNKKFDAGVTSVQSHPFRDHVIAVGSYSNRVTLYDTRKPLAPLSVTDVGGGAWRVKWHPSSTRKDDLAVACMHDGFKVIRFNSDEAPAQTTKRFDSHQSLAYGIDWSFGVLPGGESLVGSCSFYDHTLHLWTA